MTDEELAKDLAAGRKARYTAWVAEVDAFAKTCGIDRKAAFKVLLNITTAKELFCWQEISYFLERAELELSS